MTTANAQPSPSQRLDDLAEIIRAYNQVTSDLQKSHESLHAEVVRLQEQLASTDAQLQRSKRLAALGEMAAGIAHEVRNPLAAIGLYARMIVEDLEIYAGKSSVLAATTENARKIASAVRGLDGVVNDVLSFSRDITPRSAMISVDDLFRRAVESQRQAIEHHAIRCDIIESDLCVHADADLLHQALVNVVRNAIEAMAEERSGRPRVLMLSARRQGAQVAMSIRDTGPGIASQNIDRIFNPFFTTRNTGTGLGLAIVHRIIDAHGGAVSVCNDVTSGGAVFELLIPFSGSRAAALPPTIELVGETR